MRVTTLARRAARASRTSLIALGASVAVLTAACNGTEEPPRRTVASVGVAPAQHTLYVGDEVALSAQPLDEQGQLVEGRTIVWSSSDQTVATVSSAGRVTALAAGTAIVRATVDGKVGEAQIVVNVAPVARVDLDVSEVSLETGELRALAFVAKDAAGRVLQGRTATWTSSDPTVAEVSADGNISAKTIGTATVTVTVEGKTASAAITVTRAAVASVGVSPSGILLEIGESRQLTAVVKDTRGTILTDRTVTWATDGPNATVTANGLLIGRHHGYATVIATCEGKTFGVAVTISLAETGDYDLLYSRPGQTNTSEIFVLSPGADVAPVHINAGNASRQPSASPDGDRIVFAVSQIDLGTQERVDDIFAVDRNGMNMKQLTTARGIDDQPAWSPTGGRIAYRHLEEDGRGDIWVMNTDGTNAVNLTADLPADAYRTSPAWSADGTRIAFVSSHSDNAGTETSIWTMRADGSDKRRLTATFTGFDANPTWSPDGQRIAFIRYYAGEADIAIVSTAGGEPVRLTLPGHQWTPAWSPDGEMIAFAQSDYPYDQLYTVLPNGTGLRLRTVDSSWGGGYGPAWIRKP